jgi:hypothetical protein
MTPNIPERLFEVLCTDTRQRCETGELGDDDLLFIANLPSRAEQFGFEPHFGEQMRMRFMRLLSRAPRGRRRAVRQPYAYDQRVVDLRESGLSVRQIARKVRVSKANIERTLREYRRGPKQAVFGFYRELPPPEAAR